MESHKQSEEVLYHREGQLAVVTLNRPAKYNAINMGVKQGLVRAFSQAQKDKEVRAVLLTGNGKGFCAGADMSELAMIKDEDGTIYDVRDDLMINYNSVIKMIIHMEKPVICGINGPVAGAGIGIALACDYKVMAATASMRYAFVNIALVPDAGSSWFLVRAVGYTKAMEIITGGEKIPADECLRLGLINQVIPSELFKDGSVAFAQKIANGPTAAIVGTKRILNFALNNGLFDTIDYEALEQIKVIGKRDNREGVMAFMEKRKPDFKGE